MDKKELGVLIISTILWILIFILVNIPLQGIFGLIFGYATMLEYRRRKEK